MLTKHLGSWAFSWKSNESLGIEKAARLGDRFQFSSEMVRVKRL